MEELEVIEQFCMVYTEEQLRKGINLGKIEYLPLKEQTIFDSKINIKGELLTFYEHTRIANFSYLGGIFSCQLYSKGELLKGLEGWRWYYENGEKKEDPQWKKSWIAIGNKNDDIFFVKTEEDLCPVYGIIAGDSLELLLSRNFNLFLKMITYVMELESEFNYKIKDENFNLKTDFIEKCYRGLLKIMPSEKEVKNFISFFF